MTPDSPSPLPAPSTAERERVVQALCAHFANDQLSVEDLEGRLDLAYKAASPADLNALLADLPALPTARSAWGATDAQTPATSVAVAQNVPARGVVHAILGGDNREGVWTVPRHLRVVAALGGANLDLRHAILAPDVTEIEVFTLMGGVNIIVPPGVHVECLGSALLGGFDLQGGPIVPPSPSQPVVRVTGTAVLGGVSIRVLPPGGKFSEKMRSAWNTATGRTPARRGW